MTLVPSNLAGTPPRPRRVSTISRMALIIFLAGLIIVTAISATNNDHAFVRIWDFPRLQIAFLIVTTYFILAAVCWGRKSGLLLIGLLSGTALSYQIWRVWPYIVPHAIEGAAAAVCPSSDQISVLVANVKLDNQDTALLLTMVKRMRPDLVLLLETTKQWDEALTPLNEYYPYRVSEPRPEGYGMHLLSRLPLNQPTVRVLLNGEHPSIWTGVQLRSGQAIRFVGLHPAPPPLSDTTRRDAVFMITAQAIRSTKTPAIVAGDFNDAPWSRTAQLFRQVGGLADPRVGRGLMSTFNANWPLLRWPLDHVYHTNDFAVLGVAPGDDIGSDHFPYFATLCLVNSRTSLPKPSMSEMSQAKRLIAAGRRVSALRKAPVP